MKVSSYDRNKEYTLHQTALGAELEQLIRTTTGARGDVLDPVRMKLPAGDQAKLEAAISKAGYFVDSAGNWFKQVGLRKVKLEADNEFGKAGATVDVPDWVHLPSPGKAPTAR